MTSKSSLVFEIQAQELIRISCQDYLQSLHQNHSRAQAWDYTYLKILSRLMAAKYGPRITRMEEGLLSHLDYHWMSNTNIYVIVYFNNINMTQMYFVL